jgi:hypothetical protein
VFREHIEGRADHEHQIWLLLTMELWLRNLPRLSSPWQHDADRGSVSVHGPGVADVAPAAPPASLVSPAHP